jgi:hypothetical protein
MQHLRNARHIARFVLACFALSIGVAFASPMVKPEVMYLICSGSGTTSVVSGGDDGAIPVAGHGPHCPLCAGVSAPPPVALVDFEVPLYLSHVLRSSAGLQNPAYAAGPPPARGPPAF